MAEAISPGTGRRYGVERICRVWDVARSTFYAVRAVGSQEQPPRTTVRRGPKPAISDTDLLAAIRADLARSPWSGEGHRKVWARLRVLVRVLDGLRVARKRVLRLMSVASRSAPSLVSSLQLGSAPFIVSFGLGAALYEAFDLRPWDLASPGDFFMPASST